VTATGPDESPRFGEYEIESMIGRGSIGKVYLARHRRIGRRVALKTVNLDQKFEDDLDRIEFHKRLQREAELCGKLQHPNIATLYDVGYDDDIVSWLAIEYVDGESLLARLKRTRPLPVDDALAIGADILRGLAFAHDKGVIHRDIKPANVLITSEGQAKIADFGIARPLNSSLTATNSLLGTPNYMSPEQVKSAPVTVRSDLFSVGVVMYEMLTGVKAFAAPELSSILFNVVHHTPPAANEVNAAVPEPVARIVAKLLAKSPIDRYATAADALKDVERARRELASPPIDYATLTSQHDTTTPLPRSIEPPPVVLEEEEPAVVTEEAETERYGLRRPVSLPAFWAIVIVLLAGLVGAVFAIRSEIRRHETPAPGVNVRQLNVKRRALDSARALVKNGRYDEAIRAYDAYLAAYPQSSIARDERAAAQHALDEATHVTVVAAPPKTSRKPNATPEPPPPQEQKPPSRWDRIKRWFHRGT
jgi:serine/threonine protein kinase